MRRASPQTTPSPTSLEVFICSLVERGFKTAYEFHREAGLSVGSSIPALSRLQRAGLLNKEIVSTGDRRSSSYTLSPSGRKFTQTAWRSMLQKDSPSDPDTILRVVELANHYSAPAEQIRLYLNRAAGRKALLAKKSAKENRQMSHGFAYRVAKSDFERVRLKAESEFLRSVTNLFRRPTRKPPRKTKKDG